MEAIKTTIRICQINRLSFFFDFINNYFQDRRFPMTRKVGDIDNSKINWDCINGLADN
jgi:hypothetical protein